MSDRRLDMWRLLEEIYVLEFGYQDSIWSSWEELIKNGHEYEEKRMQEIAEKYKSLPEGFF